MHAGDSPPPAALDPFSANLQETNLSSDMVEDALEIVATWMDTAGFIKLIERHNPRITGPPRQ
jgi:hypothetical protein